MSSPVTTTMKSRVAQAQAAGLHTQNLRDIDWSTIAALVLAPGVPLTHPTPHWTVRLRARADVEIIGDIELFCRERDKSGGAGHRLPARRHHRHQRQIDDHGADHASHCTAPAATRRWAAISACRCWRSKPSRRAASMCWKCRPIRSIWRLRCSATVGILHQRHRRSSRPPRHHGELRRCQGRCCRRGRRQLAVIGVDDRFTRATAPRIERAGKNVLRVSVEAPLREGYYAEGTRIVNAVGGKAHPLVQLAGIGSLRGAHNAQNAACAVAACVALGIDVPTIQRGLVTFPGLAHRMQQVGRKETTSGNIISSTTPRRPMPTRRPRRWQLQRHLLDRRRQAEDGGIDSLADFFPRIRKAY